MIFQAFVTVIALVLIFVFSVNKFSAQIQRVAGDKLKSFLQKLTNRPLKGVLLGTVATSVLQSSTATTVMTAGLVDAGVITFAQSIGVIFGANIGTTITSQLIALNIVAVAPFIIIAGFLFFKVRGRFNKYGKSIFYFGLIFFCISLITQVVAPLAHNETIISLVSSISGLIPTITVGILLTIIFQSSSITNGLILVLVASGLVDFPQAVGFILGANIGTTSTTLLASIALNKSAQKTAIAHFLFNLLGVILVIPFLGLLSGVVAGLGGSIVQQVANIHLIFNILIAFIFLVGMGQFVKLVEFVAGWNIFQMKNKEA